MKTRVVRHIINCLFITAVLFGTSCEEYLNLPPEGSVLPKDQFSTTGADEQLVNAVYNILLSWDMHSFPWIGVSSIVSDDADKGSTDGDTGADKDKLDNFTFTSDDLSFNAIWKVNYKGISRANLADDLIPKLDISAERKAQLLGETRFLRAYFYWNLVRCFGGVPLITKVPDPTNEEDIAAARTRATKQEVYDQIISDLTYASENLESVLDLNPEEIGRATSGAARTFLAKVWLYQKNWQMVYNLTTQVMLSGEYRLIDNYAEIWRESGENCAESIFEVQAQGTEEPNRGIEGYVEVQTPRPQMGWGFNVPTQDLLNSYEEGDIRKDATIIFPGEVLWDSTVIDSNLVNPMYNEKAYHSKTAESYNGNIWTSGKNLRVFRYAEVLLMNAEAANELGNTSEALSSLNLVRKRAGLDDITSTDQSELRTIIRHERRVELAFEHDRFFDLIRQGLAGEVMRTHGKDFVDGKHELFPIPLEQIKISGYSLTQNPNY